MNCEVKQEDGAVLVAAGCWSVLGMGKRMLPRSVQIISLIAETAESAAREFCNL